MSGDDFKLKEYICDVCGDDVSYSHRCYKCGRSYCDDCYRGLEKDVGSYYDGGLEPGHHKGLITVVSTKCKCGETFLESDLVTQIMENPIDLPLYEQDRLIAGRLRIL